MSVTSCPPERCSPIMPEPVMAASSSAVPRSSVQTASEIDGSRTAGRAAAPVGLHRRLGGADEGADERPVDLRGQRIDVQAFPGQEGPRVLEAVLACRFDADPVEPGSGELGDVLIVAERAGDAADPQLHTLLDL